jgi:hypothetical protein
MSRFQGMNQEHLLPLLLGALVDTMGGIVELDTIALEKFSSEEFYAVKLDFQDGLVVLEVLNEDPAKA